ncbi:MAG: hypothetical protein ABI200_04315, partial [Gaiellales bacterium]
MVTRSNFTDWFPLEFKKQVGMVGGMKFSSLLAVALAIPMLFATSAVAAPDSITRTSGSTTATLNQTDDGPELIIVREGETIRHETITDSRCGVMGCIPVSLNGKNSGPALMVRNIDMDPEPEVIVGLFGGGMGNCCFLVHIYDLEEKPDWAP